MKITNEMIHIAYEISKCAYNGIYTFSEAKEEIHRTTGMNPNSAADYIHNFRYMIEGERYVRLMSLYATTYYVTKIREDYGEKAFIAALESNRKHVAYYNALSYGKRRCIEEMIRNFENN